jgi:threonine dehydrogenase-like Zn-dependent dehydrogenase
MSGSLTWDGRGVVQETDGSPAPKPGQLLVAVSHCLFEPGNPARCLSALATVLHSGSSDSLPVGSTVCFATHVFANRQVVPQAQCHAISGVPTEQALLVPVIAGILRLMAALETDLGWTAVVNGEDLAARLLRQVAHSAGARQVLVSTAGKRLAPGSDNGARDTEVPLQQVLSGIGGSVVAIDTTARPSDIQNLMSALPALNTCGLYGYSSGGVAAVNFYLDVHRKNIQIVGSSQNLQAQDLDRAQQFVRCGRVAVADMPRVPARKHDAPTPTAANPQILEWL